MVTVLHVLVALLPVLLFLAGLQLMDSFKLVPMKIVGMAVGAGGIAALAAALLHGWLLPASGLSDESFVRYVSPMTEETLKAAFIVSLFVRRRVGFLVDAAVLGFAAGTGFALVENIDYLRNLLDAPLMLWLIRGLGTAVLHGATVAIFAMVSRTLSDRKPDHLWLVFWPGWVAAVMIHSAFNHVPLPPMLMTLLQLVVLPPLLLLVFQRSERETREWVGEGLDLDFELLQLVSSDVFEFTRFGTYLRDLRKRLPGPTVADMFCLLRLELELSVRARAMVQARELGIEVPVDADLRACLAEVEYLQASIGRTGMIALEPLRVVSHRDHWHRYLLSGS